MVFGKKKVTEKELTSQLVDLNGFRSIISALDEIEPWALQEKHNPNLFTEMLSDARIGSLVENRQDKVLRLDMGHLDSEDDAFNEAHRTAFSFNTIQKIALQLLNALVYGVAVSEVVWKKEAGLFIPSDFIHIPRSLYSFPPFQEENPMTPVLTVSNTTLDAPYKFLIHRNDRGTGKPSGVSILRSVYWPWQFKKLGFKFWVMAAERIGVPSILALFETKTDVDARKRAKTLADALHKIRSGSSLALGNVKDVKYLNAEGAIKDFDTLIAVCNTEISYGLTGQSLTTNEAQYGTRANAVLHDDTFAAVVSKDAQALQSTIQQLYDWFAAINFPGRKPLAFEIDAGEAASWEAITRAIELKIPVSKRALYNRYKLPEPENDADSFVAEIAPLSSGTDAAEEEFADGKSTRQNGGNAFFF